MNHNTLPNGMKVIIIDNELKNINEFTNDKMIKCINVLGNSNNFSNPNYPGIQISIKNTNPNFLNEIKSLVKEHSDFQKTQSLTSSIDLSIGYKFKPKKAVTTNPHVDDFFPGMYAMMIYLNKPDDCWGGTDIFKSKILNRCSWPEYKKKPNNKDINNDINKIYKDKPYGYNLKKNCGLIINDKQWKVVKHFKMKYNRMIIYEASLFHCAHIDTFERFKNNKRYTLNFWCDKLLFVRRDEENTNPEHLLKEGLIDGANYSAIIKDKKNHLVKNWIYMKHLNK